MIRALNPDRRCNAGTGATEAQMMQRRGVRLQPRQRAASATRSFAHAQQRLRVTRGVRLLQRSGAARAFQYAA